MGKISLYPSDNNISLSDKLIGTDAENNDATKNFTVGGLLNLFNDPEFLTGFVPYSGATQNLNLGDYSLYADYIQTYDISTGGINATTGFFDNLYKNGYRAMTYAQAYSLVTQQQTAINTAKTVEFEFGAFQDDITISANQINFNAIGKFVIEVRARVEHTGGGGDAQLSMWLKYPTVNVPNSRQVYTVANTHIQEISYSFLVSVANATDSILVQWSTSNLAARYVPTLAASFYPAAPSAIVNVYRVG